MPKFDFSEEKLVINDMKSKIVVKIISLYKQIPGKIIREEQAEKLVEPINQGFFGGKQ